MTYISSKYIKRGAFMDSHTKTYEQYCCVKGKNVAVEETTYHNGIKIYRCSMSQICKNCKNSILKQKFDLSYKSND